MALAINCGRWLKVGRETRHTFLFPLWSRRAPACHVNWRFSGERFFSPVNHINGYWKRRKSRDDMGPGAVASVAKFRLAKSLARLLEADGRCRQLCETNWRDVAIWSPDLRRSANDQWPETEVATSSESRLCRWFNDADGQSARSWTTTTTAYCISLYLFSGGTGTRQLPGSGRVLHYPVGLHSRQ